MKLKTLSGTVIVVRPARPALYLPAWILDAICALALASAILIVAIA